LASQINASNSGFGGIVSTGDSSGVLQLQAAGTTIATIQSTGLNLGSNGVVFSDSSTQTAAASPYVLKNRIINGDMRIDQRNAGASVTPTANATYTLDRWATGLSQSSKFSVQQNAGSVTPPTGYTNYLGATVVSAVTPSASDNFAIWQFIEGFNVADLGWGTANAKTVTLSFWVRSSVTGTYYIWISNGSQNRSYPASYSISSANTWTQISITISGDTTGTWATNNTAGLQIWFDLGSGSTYTGTANTWQAGTYLQASGAAKWISNAGATFYITGVQLEIGTSATPFERRLYDKEFASCQRYYQTTARIMPCIITSSFTSRRGYYPRTVTMRATPTETGTQSGGGTVSFFGSALNTGIDVDGATAGSESNFTNYTASAEL
jgi:hypothetical protein